MTFLTSNVKKLGDFFKIWWPSQNISTLINRFFFLSLGENDLIEAEAEEIEGKLLQKKQLDKLDDEDFFDMFTPSMFYKQQVISNFKETHFRANLS